MKAIRPPMEIYSAISATFDILTGAKQAYHCRPEAWNHPHADRAIRVLVDEDLPFYHLAVKQAEALYGVRSPSRPSGKFLKLRSQVKSSGFEWV